MHTPAGTSLPGYGALLGIIEEKAFVRWFAGATTTVVVLHLRARMHTS